MPKRIAGGFTLVELLIAMFIFSLLTAFAFRATSMLSQSSVALEEEQYALAGLQKALLMMEREIRKLGNQSENNTKERNTANLTENVTGEDESRINLPSGVSYYLEEGSLHRIDLRLGEDKPALKLLENIEDLKMTYVESESLGNQSGVGRLPGVEFTLNHKEYGIINRVIYLGLAAPLMGSEQELVGRLKDGSEAPPATTMTQEEQDIVDAL